MMTFERREIMTKKLLVDLPLSIWAAMVLVSLLGAAMDATRQPAPAHSHEGELGASVQRVDATCLAEGTAQPESCRGQLPECLAEDGSGPGIYCWWTDPDGTGIWFNDGDESNDQTIMP